MILQRIENPSHIQAATFFSNVFISSARFFTDTCNKTISSIPLLDCITAGIIVIQCEIKV
jgi:hypothetical protein